MTFLFGPKLDDTSTQFRLWAPSAGAVEVLFPEGPPLALKKDDAGFWFGRADNRGPGTRYKFRTDALEFPDPASRQQEGGTTGWSVVCAPFEPSGRREPLRPWHETILCEVHVGTVSPEGTFAGLTERLEHFRDAGFTALEIMPINEFPGNRNWGYDGTLIFAPDSAYGPREDLRRLVDRAHDLGLCLILDVVYNHFGKFNNFIERYAPEWFDEGVETPWGKGIDFTQDMVRQFYYENACMWLEEFDFDGLRFDSVHEMKTEARDVFLSDLAKSCRAVKSDAKLIIENMDNIASWLDREQNQPKDFTAQWNDDIHHVLHYLATGDGKNGYSDGSRNPIADLEKGLADGFVHDGEAEGESDGTTRGEPASRLPPDAFVSYMQNHDQIGNRADSKRLPDRVSAEKLDFLHLSIMLAPQIPLFFMGEEAHLRTPFPFFIDLPEDAAEPMRADRCRQMRESFGEDVEDGALPDPNGPHTFESAKLNWGDYGNPDRRAALDRFRILAEWRRARLWPLVATPCLDARSGRQGTAIVVSWIFEAGTLSMALNPSDLPADIACIITASPLSTGEFSQQDEVLRLGAWSAVVW
ncbi:alpha-amylase family glycosyl hydrolase [Devosia ginsengisoli]|uniref:Malto-oligosyltrehalose trehalohydrolase n=1 Tax=Devosia ginsengisoli TaxID=400770 RepID=A0A5B8LR35_9HYPH|nr:alpha-amylase family glycosyl hydrolase [Devosia ginsengisoli]QDZ10687.1 malto-oligosyltrehalose trehalohydrolase [Devosia ginsengisoli]